MQGKIVEDTILQWEIEMFNAFESVVEDGKMIEFLGEEFLALPNVFWPSKDTELLVKHMKVFRGEQVLDLCTGTGAVAIHASKMGACKVVAVDIGGNAVRSATFNIQQKGLDSIVEVRRSNMFDAIRNDEIFNVITINPPFRNHHAVREVERTMWDSELLAHRSLFLNAANHLSLYGRIYLTQASFGAVNEMLQLADQNHFAVKKIGEQYVDCDMTFYVFELTKRS